MTPTTLLYMTDSSQRTATAEAVVVAIDTESPQMGLILNQTNFYPQGGGQPSDTGVISGEKGVFAVSHVSYNGGAVLHKGKLSGELKVGDVVKLEIDWARRARHMQLHTAGHIVDQAVKNVVAGAKAVDGNHGIGKKSYIEYETIVPSDAVAAIQAEVESIIAADLPITTKMVSYDELIAMKISLPPDLPQNKSLRILQIGEYPAMPDGGTHLTRTGECQVVTVTEVRQKDGAWRVMYDVGVSKAVEAVQEAIEAAVEEEAADADPNNSPLREFERQVDAIRSKFATAKKSGDAAALQTQFLGKKGEFNQLAPMLRILSAADKKNAGQVLNQLRTELENEIAIVAATSNAANQKWTDVTMPGEKPAVGHMHPVSQAMEEITQIFERIGFTRVRYPEVDWDYYVFESLNMPPNHPARDEWETFFVDSPSDKKMGKVVLTTHTSNGQVHEMERLKSKPPIRMINIARCYRRQQDATHTQMFHQFEGLVVDKGITIQHLKGTLDYFAESFYGPGTKSRIRPFHFRFTEPSFEVDFSCHICGGTGIVKHSKDDEGTKCKFCKSGWHEVGGAGMVHPNVLKAGGIDPDVYTGFAFGWGIERTYTLRKGLNIDDIRLLYSGDLRFLSQF